MKILMLGDSVGMQFHQVLEEAAGATWDNRTLFKFAWGGHESVSIAAPIQGGCVLGAELNARLFEAGSANVMYL